MTETNGSQTETIEQARGLIARREWPAARALLHELLERGPQGAEVYNDFGRVLNNTGDLDGAAQAFASAIALRSDYPEAHNNLGHVLRAQGDYQRAAEHFECATKQKPDYAKAHFNLASALNLLSQNEQAVASLRRGLKLAPDNAMAHFNIATLYRFLDVYEQAEAHFREAFRLDQNLLEAQVGLAGLQVHLGRVEQALDTYASVLKQDPKNVEARVGIADIQDLQGQREQAMETLASFDSVEQGAPGGPGYPKIAVARAQLEKNAHQHEQALQTLLSAQQSDPAGCAQMPRFYFTLADVYDKLGRYDEAMENYHVANRLKTEKYEEREFVTAIDALCEVYSAQWLQQSPRSGNNSDRPIFIIGMPRSGTSLVEQILARHPRVYGAGELNILVELVRGLGRSGGRSGSSTSGAYPACVRGLNAAALGGLAERYLDSLNAIDATATHVTDKLPHNFLHLGLISLLFPDSHIIHCKRDYRDTALSCYFQNFSSASMAFSNNLESIAKYYAQYERLMAHWRSVLTVSIHELQYETLVADQEVETRHMLGFLGLDWDPACLAFHEADRFVNTASYAQVARPMYNSSVARYRNYQKHLAPLSVAGGKSG